MCDHCWHPVRVEKSTGWSDGNPMAEFNRILSQCCFCGQCRQSNLCVEPGSSKHGPLVPKSIEVNE